MLTIPRMNVVKIMNMLKLCSGRYHGLPAASVAVSVAEDDVYMLKPNSCVLDDSIGFPVYASFSDRGGVSIGITSTGLYQINP